MTAPDRPLRRTLGNLALALLNATLILVALCLWLGVHLAGTVHAITTDAARSLAGLQPIAEQIRDVAAEVAGLRKDLAARTAQASTGALDARVGALETRLGQSLDQLEALTANPTLLVDHAIDRTADRIAEGVNGVLNCARPAS
jgi:hypothetical protein